MKHKPTTLKDRPELNPVYTQVKDLSTSELNFRKDLLEKNVEVTTGKIEDLTAKLREARKALTTYKSAHQVISSVIESRR